MLDQFLDRRQALKERIESSNSGLIIHYLTVTILSLNIVIIIYAVISILVRLTMIGVALLDSLPIAFYVIPLLVFLPLIIRDYYLNRSALMPVVITLIMCVFYLLLVRLVHLFYLMFAMNLLACSLMVILGRLRPKTSIKTLGKKGVVYLVVLNLIGLLFPASILIMGQTQIAAVEYSSSSSIFLDMPLYNWDFPYLDHAPDNQTLNSLQNNEFGLSFRIDGYSQTSMDRLQSWLTALNKTTIEYNIVFSAVHDIYRNTTADFVRTFNAFAEYTTIFVNLTQSMNVLNLPSIIYFDLTLTRTEWQSLLSSARSIDLTGFSITIRSISDNINQSIIIEMTKEIVNQAHNNGLLAGVVVDAFVLDDIQDGDTLFMKYCGVTYDSMSLWDKVQYYASRTRFSLEMINDVGEYLVYSYSRSVGNTGDEDYELRLGLAGNATDNEGRQSSVYGNLDVLIKDIKAAYGNGVSCIVLESLPFILTSFGDSALSTIRNALGQSETVPITYTFRIYAFRAVFTVIDSFDVIML